MAPTAFTIAVATVLPSLLLFLTEMWFILNPALMVTILTALKAAGAAAIAVF